MMLTFDVSELALAKNDKTEKMSTYFYNKNKTIVLKFNFFCMRLIVQTIQTKKSVFKHEKQVFSNQKQAFSSKKSLFLNKNNYLSLLRCCKYCNYVL